MKEAVSRQLLEIVTTLSQLHHFCPTSKDAIFSPPAIFKKTYDYNAL